VAAGWELRGLRGGEGGGVSGFETAVTLEEAIAATAETNAVDFKREFDPTFEGDWCELLKDIVAIGNSGGGAIVIGVDRAGITVGVDASLAKKLDPAAIGDKIRKYTGGCQPVCTSHCATKDSKTILVLGIHGTAVPVAFEKAGTYNNKGGKPVCAFRDGSFYFRHNTKSEPGTTEDLELAIEREVSRRRDEWLGNIRKVMEAPAGAGIVISPKNLHVSDMPGTPSVRLSNSPDATPLAYRSRDETHPHRLKELLVAVNRRVPKGVKITSGDILKVRRAYDVDRNPNWTDIAKHGSKQYSVAFEDWLVEQFSTDPRFAAKAKLKARREGK
jgi:hypothetical protein